MQCEECMTNAGLCTQEQFDNGKEEPVDHITGYNEMKSNIVAINDECRSPAKTNIYSKLGIVSTNTTP